MQNGFNLKRGKVLSNTHMSTATKGNPLVGMTLLATVRVKAPRIKGIWFSPILPHEVGVRWRHRDERSFFEVNPHNVCIFEDASRHGR